MMTNAILVAGGHGSRLYPFTRYTQKTLLPLYNRPVIDFALATIRRAGVKNITIISNEFIGQIAQHVGGGLDGEKIHYVLEEEPLGVGYALNLARPYNQNCRLLVYFSDNITTLELTDEVNRFNTTEASPGCVLLAREEQHPEAFGVAILDENGNVSGIIEKPENPPSNLAIGGIYLFDEHFWTYLDTAMSQQGDGFSISDVIRQYIQLGNAKLLSVGEETWVDCGTPETLFLASQMVKDGKLNPEPHR